MRKASFLMAALLFIGPPLSPVSRPDLLKDADLLLDMMEYRSAVERYQRALAADPTLRDVRRKMAYAQYRLDRMEDAFFWLKEELDKFPDNADAYDLLSSLFFKQGEIDRAGELLKKRGFTVRLNPENTNLGGLTLFILGMNFKEKQVDSQARLCLRMAIEKGFDPVRCYVQLIDMELARYNWKSAWNATAEAVRACGPRAEFYFLQGWACGELKSWSQAGSYFQNALSLKPEFKEILFNLAAACFNGDDLGPAAEHFQDCLILDPSDARAEKGLACCLVKLGLADGTTEACPSVLAFSRESIDRPDREYGYRLQNELVTVLQNLNAAGLSFIEKGQNLEAVSRFRNALALDPECPEIHFNLGTVMRWLGESGQAERHALMALRRRDYFGELPPRIVRQIRREKGESLRLPLKIPAFRWTFESALEEGNGFLDAYDLLGCIAYEKGEPERARLAFEKVLELDDEDAMGHFNLGTTLLALKDLAGAEKEWRKAIHYDKSRRGEQVRTALAAGELQASVVVYKKPVAFYAHKSLAELYKAQRRSDESLKEFENAAELETGDPEPHYELGRLYLEKGNRKKAAFHFERYLYLGGKKESEVKALMKSWR